MTARTIALAAAKGGVAKSTIASALAVQAVSEGARVALVDAEPQASLGLWWERRGEPDNPGMFTVDDDRGLGRAVAKLRAGPWDYVIVDTPPAMMDRIEAAIRAADVVLIPVRASIFDVEAISPVTEVCKDYGKTYAFVLSHCIAISTTLAGLYGYMSADTVFYGGIRAASLCAVAVVGACCPAWASHHWQERRYGQCVITWFVCAVCLAVTLGGGIGTIAGGAERSTAERAKASSAAKNDDAELARITTELAKLPAHRPAGTVTADLEAARASRAYKLSHGCQPVEVAAKATRDSCDAFRKLQGELETAKAADAWRAGPRLYGSPWRRRQPSSTQTRRPLRSPTCCAFPSTTPLASTPS